MGTYTAELVVIYDGGKQASAQVGFTVSAAPQNAPMPPSEKGKTEGSITLERIEDNANGAKAQYSKNGGSTWQDSPVFSGLMPNTTYAFAARYSGTKNHMPSPASAVTEITTVKKDLPEGNNPPEGNSPSEGNRPPEGNNPPETNNPPADIVSPDTPTKEELEERFFLTAIHKDKNYCYKVLSIKRKEAEVIRAKNPKSKKIQIPDQVKINGVRYKVTSVAKSAFSNNKKAVSATVGKNVKKIGKDAFRGCKKLKKIFIKTKKLKRVGKNAFRGIARSAQIKVPKKKYVVYRKMLAKKGQRSTVKIRY